MGVEALATTLGFLPATIRNHARVLSLSEPEVSVEEQVTSDRQEHLLKRKQKVTDKKYRTLLEEFERLEAEHNALLDFNLSRPQDFTITPYRGTVSESTVIACASDWHVAERVRASEVSDLNQYTLDIARERASNFFKMVKRFTELERRNTPINSMILWLGGDFITGNIHEEMLETCAIPPVEEAVYAMGLIKSGIDFLLQDKKLKSLVIPCSAGNHSRITKKTRSATEMGNSLELFVYRSLEQVYEKDRRVKFVIGNGYHTYVKVYDMMLRFHHGHAVRYAGGVGGLTIPLNKAIAQWNKSRWADIDVLGHWHQFLDNGNAIVNGSLIGFNAYAVRIKASFERPSQAFFVINRRLNAKIVTRPILV